MIEIFCNIPLKTVLQIKATDIDNITNTINNLFKEEPKFIDRFKYNGVEFGFIPKLDEITFGEYVDLDNYLSEWSLMHKAMCVLYRPISFTRKDKYLIEDYEGSDVYDMQDVSLDIVFSSLVFFLEFKERIIESYPELFSKSEGNSFATAETGFNEKWSWYQSIYGLAQGDVRRFDEVTQLKLHSCLQYLAFEKDKADLQQQMFKKK